MRYDFDFAQVGGHPIGIEKWTYAALLWDFEQEEIWSFFETSVRLYCSGVFAGAAGAGLCDCGHSCKADVRGADFIQAGAGYYIWPGF